MHLCLEGMLCVEGIWEILTCYHYFSSKRLLILNNPRLNWSLLSVITDKNKVILGRIIQINIQSKGWFYSTHWLDYIWNMESLLIHSFKKYLKGICYLPCHVLSIRYALESKTYVVPTFTEFSSQTLTR